MNLYRTDSADAPAPLVDFFQFSGIVSENSGHGAVKFDLYISLHVVVRDTTCFSQRTYTMHRQAVQCIARVFSDVSAGKPWSKGYINTRVSAGSAINVASLQMQ